MGVGGTRALPRLGVPHCSFRDPRGPCPLLLGQSEAGPSGKARAREHSWCIFIAQVRGAQAQGLSRQSVAAELGAPWPGRGPWLDAGLTWQGPIAGGGVLSGRLELLIPGHVGAGLCPSASVRFLGLAMSRGPGPDALMRPEQQGVLG